MVAPCLAHILQASYKHTHENEGVGYKLRRFANQTLNLPVSHYLVSSMALYAFYLQLVIYTCNSSIV